MASINFYGLYFNGLLIRSERSLDKMIRWIGRNRLSLVEGCYSVEYLEMNLFYLFVYKGGRIVFDLTCF